MASSPKWYDRVMETVSSHTGTGTYTLAGAVTGYQTFAAVGNGNSCHYCAMAVDGSGNPNGGWEVGIGTYTTSGTTLSRDKILASSNSNSAVSWSSANLRVFLTQAAIVATPVVGDMGGRLTTESGVGVSTSDRTAQGTLYYTPYAHNRVVLWDGSCWRRYSFTEVSLSLTVTSGKNYDVFLYDNSGTLTLELSAAWTDDSTPADTITKQDGVPVKSGATTRRWVGTIRASGSNVVADANAQRFVWNADNQVPRTAYKLFSSSFTYTTNSERDFNNTASDTQVSLVIGAAQRVDAYWTSRVQMNSDNTNYIQYLRMDGANSTPLLQWYINGFTVAALTQNISLPYSLSAGYHVALLREQCTTGSATPNETQTTVKFFG